MRCSRVMSLHASALKRNSTAPAHAARCSRLFDGARQTPPYVTTLIDRPKSGALRPETFIEMILCQPDDPNRGLYRQATLDQALQLSDLRLNENPAKKLPFGRQCLVEAIGSVKRQPRHAAVPPHHTCQMGGMILRVHQKYLIADRNLRRKGDLRAALADILNRAVKQVLAIPVGNNAPVEGRRSPCGAAFDGLSWRRGSSR